MLWPVLILTNQGWVEVGQWYSHISCPHRSLLVNQHSRIIHQILTKKIMTFEIYNVWKSDLYKHRFLQFYAAIFSLVLVSTEKLNNYQTLNTVFDHISKYLQVAQNSFQYIPRLRF